MGTLDHLKLTDTGLSGRVQSLLDAPAELLLPERLLMYSLVRGLRPVRCLEIGTHFGGSTAITCAALDDVGAGRLVCVDPSPLVPAELWATLAHRATMIRGTSPSALPDAVALSGGLFDFVFIDGDHTHAGVMRDVAGVLTVAAPGAHLLFHDAHYWEVRDAIDECVARDPGRLLDAGTLSALATNPIEAPDGTSAQWGGFRLLRVAATCLT
ncbi:MAG TPA: class I SAM-dependent methyltransferase [Vicinamibacterales bacterium]|nr:class I SAM-dependent methyltransferase [Vicinamibacterales bacterium]